MSYQIPGTEAWYWLHCADADSVPYVCGGDPSLCTELLPALQALGAVTDPSQFCAYIEAAKGLTQVWKKYLTYASPAGGGLVQCSYPGKPRQPSLVDTSVQQTCGLLLNMVNFLNDPANTQHGWGWFYNGQIGECTPLPNTDEVYYNLDAIVNAVGGLLQSIACLCSAPSAGGPEDFSGFVNCCKEENANLLDRLDKILKKI